MDKEEGPGEVHSGSPVSHQIQNLRERVEALEVATGVGNKKPPKDSAREEERQLKRRK